MMPEQCAATLDIDTACGLRATVCAIGGHLLP
jgi:hypothetical protein